MFEWFEIVFLKGFRCYSQAFSLSHRLLWVPVGLWEKGEARRRERPEEGYKASPCLNPVPSKWNMLLHCFQSSISPLLQALKEILIKAGVCWGDLYLCVSPMSSSEMDFSGAYGGCSEGKVQDLKLEKHCSALVLSQDIKASVMHLQTSQ